MTERVYTINELKTLISESASEFKAKIGDGVASANEKESKSTYSTAKKKAKGLDGGGSEEKVKHNLSDKKDGNKTMLDYTMEEECGSNFRDRVEAQAEGYTSTLEKKNDIDIKRCNIKIPNKSFL